jgi:predicted secreted protein
MSARVLGLKDRDEVITVLVGDGILLRLPENPSTGYRWAGEIPDFLRLTRDENERHGTAPGAGGLRTMELVAVAPGRATLNFACGQAWEPTAPPTDRFSVTIDVVER